MTVPCMACVCVQRFLGSGVSPRTAGDKTARGRRVGDSTHHELSTNPTLRTTTTTTVGNRNGTLRTVRDFMYSHKVPQLSWGGSCE